MKAKTVIVIAIVAACFVVFVSGKEAIFCFAGAREYAKDAVKDRISDEFESFRSKSMLGKLDKVITKKWELWLRSSYRVKA